METITIMAETMAFATLGTIQLFHAFNVKSIFGSLFINYIDNKYLNYASLLSGALLYGVILIPGINKLLDVTLPDAKGWIIVIIASFSIVVFVEIGKWILRATVVADKYQKKGYKNLSISFIIIVLGKSGLVYYKLNCFYIYVDSF